MIKNKSLFTSTRDKNLMRFLFESKGATYSQIKKSIFQNISGSYGYTVLSRLRKSGFISTAIERDNTNHRYYFLTKKGAEKFISETDLISGVKLKSECMEHDSLLISIRNILERIKISQLYFTENMLVSDLYFKQLDGVREEINRVNPDAMMILSDEIGPFFVTVELEISDKGRGKYKNLFEKYSFCPSFSHVFYIVKDEKAKIFLTKLLHSSFGPEKNKILFITIKDLLSSKDEIVFDLSDGSSSILKLKPVKQISKNHQSLMRSKSDETFSETDLND
jgi:DNA-binding PadR family transcriptional regulator